MGLFSFLRFKFCSVVLCLQAELEPHDETLDVQSVGLSNWRKIVWRSNPPAWETQRLLNAKKTAKEKKTPMKRNRSHCLGDKLSGGNEV